MKQRTKPPADLSNIGSQESTRYTPGTAYAEALIAKYAPLYRKGRMVFPLPPGRGVRAS